MKLKHAKGIHDFNRALAINPTLFQVSRRWKDCLLLCLESFRFFTSECNVHFQRRKIRCSDSLSVPHVFHSDNKLATAKKSTLIFVIDLRYEKLSLNALNCFFSGFFESSGLLWYERTLQ